MYQLKLLEIGFAPGNSIDKENLDRALGNQI
jgi:hypothetical protein